MQLLYFNHINFDEISPASEWRLNQFGTAVLINLLRQIYPRLRKRRLVQSVNDAT